MAYVTIIVRVKEYFVRPSLQRHYTVITLCRCALLPVTVHSNMMQE